MQPAFSTPFPEPLPAAMPQLSEKPRHGVRSWNPAPHPGHFLCNSRTAIGLQFGRSGNASGTVVAPNSGATTCTGPATVSAVGTGPHQAPYTGHTGSLYPPIAGGGMGTVAVQNNFLGIGRAGLRQYGTQISVSFADDGAIVASGGPAGPYTVSDRGDINIQNDPSVRFDLYRWDSTHDALQFGIETFPGTVTFPTASGGTCPAGWTVHQ